MVVIQPGGTPSRTQHWINFYCACMPKDPDVRFVARCEIYERSTTVRDDSAFWAWDELIRLKGFKLLDRQTKHIQKAAIETG